MSHTRRSMGAAFALLVGFAGPASAQGEGALPDPVQECARAYEDAQEHRGAGVFSRAQPELDRCRKDDCPEFIRRDCARWSKELEAEQPTVIFAAKRGDRELTDVRVSVADRVLLEHLDARAVELDAGEYDFRFEASDGELVVVHAQIQAGNKDRLVQVEFTTAARTHAAATAITTESSTAQASTAIAPGPGALPWVLLVVSAASFGTGAGLSVWGHNSEVQLRDTCSPHCTDAQVDPVRSKYLLSNVSFGVGLVTLPLAAYLFLRHPNSEHTAEGTVPVTVVASPSGVQATYGARF